MEYNCFHEEVLDNICQECGQCIEEYIEDDDTVSKSGKDDNTVYEKDLLQYELDEDFLSYVSKFIPKTVSHLKKHSRKALIFAHAQIYYLQKGNVEKVHEIKKKLVITREEKIEARKMITGSLATHSGQQYTGPKASVIIVNPSFVVKKISELSGIDPCFIPRILQLVKQVEKNEYILDENPENVVAGVIRYYSKFIPGFKDKLYRNGFSQQVLNKYSKLAEELLQLDNEYIEKLD